MLWSAAAMGMSPLQRLLRVVLPAALPEVFVGVRTGLVLALITMVTSEMIARQAGVGNILFNSLDMALYDTVYAMIVIIGAAGLRPRRGVRAPARLAGRLGRAGAPDRGGDVMRRSAIAEVLLGILPIALILALWQGLTSAGMAPPSLLPPPCAVFARLAEQLRRPDLSRACGDHAVSAVRGLCHRRRDRRDARRGGDRQPDGRRRWSGRSCACWRRCPRSRSTRRSS